MKRLVRDLNVKHLQLSWAHMQLNMSQVESQTLANFGEITSYSVGVVKWVSSHEAGQREAIAGLRLHLKDETLHRHRLGYVMRIECSYIADDESNKSAKIWLLSGLVGSSAQHSTLGV